MYQRLPYHGHCCSTKGDIGLNNQPFSALLSLTQPAFLSLPQHYAAFLSLTQPYSAILSLPQLYLAFRSLTALLSLSFVATHPYSALPALLSLTKWL